MNHDNFIVVLFCGVKVSFGGTRSRKYTNRYFNVHIIFTKLWYIGISPSLYHNTYMYLFTSIFIKLLWWVEIKLLHYFERQLSLSLLGIYVPIPMSYSKMANLNFVKQDLLHLSLLLKIYVGNYFSKLFWSTKIL